MQVKLQLGNSHTVDTYNLFVPVSYTCIILGINGNGGTILEIFSHSKLVQHLPSIYYYFVYYAFSFKWWLRLDASEKDKILL